MRRALVVLLIVALVAVTAVWVGLLALQHGARLWDRVTGRQTAARQWVPERIGDRAGGRAQGVLGVDLLETTPELRRFLGAPEDAGVLVAAVAPDSPAAAAGLEAGDVVTRIADRPVRRVAELARQVAALPGTEVQLELYRRGARRRVTVERGAQAARRPYLRYRDGDLFDLAERLQEVGERAGILGELGGVADGVAKMDAETVARALDAALGSLEGIEGEGVVEGLYRRLEAMEKRLEGLETSEREDETNDDQQAQGGS